MEMSTIFVLPWLPCYHGYLFPSQAHQLLEEEMDVVKEGMGHGEIQPEAYAQVWEECYNEVLFIPSQNRYTRASMTSKKDLLESKEKRLQVSSYSCVT